MRKTLFSMIIAASVVGTAAHADAVPSAKQSFKHEGYTYVYEVKEDAKGKTISGVRYPDAVPFTLNVKSGQVEGVSNGVPVNFSIADARGAAKGAVDQ